MNRQQRRRTSRSNPPTPGVSFLSALEGHRLAGGCDDCDAYQVIKKAEAGHTIINVCHDDTCPTLAAMEAQR